MLIDLPPFLTISSTVAACSLLPLGLGLLRSQIAHETSRRVLRLERERASLRFELDWMACLADRRTAATRLITLLEHTTDATAEGWIVSRNGKILAATTAAARLASPGGTATESLRSNRLVFPCGTEPTSSPEIVLSELPTISGSVAHDARLFSRLCQSSLFNDWSEEEASEEKASSSELALVRDMLELRTLTDLEFSSPEEMLVEFLNKLVGLTEYDRAMLFRESDDEDGLELVAVGGRFATVATMQSTRDADMTWIEDRVGERNSAGQRATKLACAPEVIREDARLLIPVCGPNGDEAWLLLSSNRQISVSESDVELAQWGAQFIVQTFERALAMMQVEHQARRDELTGLANRRTFESEFRKMLQRGSGTQEGMAVLLLDIDHFKPVNDTLGHLAGDHALRETAKVLSQTLRNGRVTDRPLLARYGGEEFVVLLEDIPESAAKRIAEELRRSIEEARVEWDGRRVPLTVSIGVVHARGSKLVGQELLAKADQALYAAKRGGRNRVIVSNEQLCAVAAQKSTATESDITCDTWTTPDAEISL